MIKCKCKCNIQSHMLGVQQFYDSKTAKVKLNNIIFSVSVQSHFHKNFEPLMAIKTKLGFVRLIYHKQYSKINEE